MTYRLETALRQGGALHVFHSAYLVCQLLALLALQRRQSLLCQAAECLSIFAQIDFGAWNTPKRYMYDSRFQTAVFMSLGNLPTRMMGASGQWCFISGYHFEVTFSKDEGLATL